ncbi:MAG: hypothetical protein A2Y17_00615 [Clostridiales bacterium GWF2_38_85]|nr:MAG: hypothetical protein A2Y17_00615 [Clostridiales bacterium GWF2_38_85]
MKKKKLLAVLLVTVLCLMSSTYAITVSAQDAVTATSVFDPVSKTVTISGTATSTQVVIKITTNEDTSPLYYGFATVNDNKYSVTRPWSSFAEGIYNVTVENLDDGSIIIDTFTTSDNSGENTAIDVIKAYADANDADPLTILQLNDTGVIAVIIENLEAYKIKIASVNSVDVDTQAKIQSLINTVNNEEAAKLGTGVSILATYNNVAKTVTITGSATCSQVIIKITKSGEVTPVWYGSADVANDSFAIVRPVSTYSAGDYNVTVENIDTNSIVTDDFTIEVDNIAPIITIGDYITTPTNQSIAVTVTTNEGTLNSESHTFDENGSFEFIATDDAGNVTKITVTIVNIDKVAPVITIGSYTTEVTDQDILVNASVNEGTLNASSNLFSENGSFEFIATDAAGNVSRTTIIITNIDKTSTSSTVSEEESNTVSEESNTVSEEESNVVSDVSEEISNDSNVSDTTSDSNPDTYDAGYLIWILIAMVTLASVVILVRNRK